VRLELLTRLKDNNYICCALLSLQLCRHFTVTNSFITHPKKHNNIINWQNNCFDNENSNLTAYWPYASYWYCHGFIQAI